MRQGAAGVRADEGLELGAGGRGQLKQGGTTGKIVWTTGKVVWTTGEVVWTGPKGEAEDRIEWGKG